MAAKMAAKMVKTVKFNRNSVKTIKSCHTLSDLFCLYKTFKTTLYAVCICLRHICNLRICSIIEVFNPFLTQYLQQCTACYYLEEHPNLYCFATFQEINRLVSQILLLLFFNKIKQQMENFKMASKMGIHIRKIHH